MKIFIDYERASICWVLNSFKHKQWQYPSLNIALFVCVFFSFSLRCRKNYARKVFNAVSCVFLHLLLKLIENKSFTLRSEHFKLQHICVKMIALISLKYLETHICIRQKKNRTEKCAVARHCTIIIVPNSKWVSHRVWRKGLIAFFLFGLVFWQ